MCILIYFFMDTFQLIDKVGQKCLLHSFRVSRLEVKTKAQLLWSIVLDIGDGIDYNHISLVRDM